MSEHAISLDISAIEGLLGQTTTVLWDIEALNNTISRLFALESAPASSSALARTAPGNPALSVRGADRRPADPDARRAAPKNAARYDEILWDRILHILGGKQGHQQVQVLLTQIHQTDARTEAAQAAFQQAMLSRMAEELVIDQAIEQINEELFASMPRR